MVSICDQKDSGIIIMGEEIDEYIDLARGRIVWLKK